MSIELRSLRGAFEHKTALLYRHVTFTGTALNAEAETLAAQLAGLGLGTRDRIALLLGNTPQFVVCMLAAMKLRASSVLLSLHMSEREISDAIRRTEALGILAHPDAGARLERVDATSEAEPLALSSAVGQLAFWRTPHTRPEGNEGELIVQFTSGVSGRSMIVPRTEANLEHELENVASCLGVGMSDATICPSPLFHAYGLVNGFLVPFFSGRPAVLVDGPFLPNDIVDAVRRYRARVLIGVPTMYKAIADAYGATATDLASLQFCLCAGAPLPESVARTFQSRYGAHIHQLYGSTESGVIAVNLMDHEDANPLAVGRPIPGTEIEIVTSDGDPVGAAECGEIVIRSPGTAAGYLDDPSLSAERFRDGRYFTGDLGTVDKNGDLVLRGRRTSFINVAGLKVDPAEVENVLATFDAVAECAVVPMRHALEGEVVKAVVVARRNTSDREVQRFCRQRLAAHKVPRCVVFVQELPRSATGKVLNKRLID